MVLEEPPVKAPEEPMPDVSVLGGGPQHRQVVLPANTIGKPLSFPASV